MNNRPVIVRITRRHEVARRELLDGFYESVALTLGEDANGDGWYWYSEGLGHTPTNHISYTLGYGWTKLQF